MFDSCGGDDSQCATARVSHQHVTVLCLSSSQRFLEIIVLTENFVSFFHATETVRNNSTFFFYPFPNSLDKFRHPSPCFHGVEGGSPFKELLVFTTVSTFVVLGGFIILWQVQWKLCISEGRIAMPDLIYNTLSRIEWGDLKNPTPSL